MLHPTRQVRPPCRIAPDTHLTALQALIVGRAIAGFGSAGIFSGALLIIANSAPLQKRPVYIGICGAMYGIASVAGPLMVPYLSMASILEALTVILGRSFHRQALLALVLLHQFADWRSDDRLHHFPVPRDRSSSCAETAVGVESKGQAVRSGRLGRILAHDNLPASRVTMGWIHIRVV